MSDLHYTFRVEWSAEDDEWVGLVAEFPSLSWLADDPVEALQGIRGIVDEVVDDMRANEEEVPESLAERRYSGKFLVRTSPELHRRLAIEAAEQGVSINQWAVQKLSGRESAEHLSALQTLVVLLRDDVQPGVPGLRENGPSKANANTVARKKPVKVASASRRRPTKSIASG